MWQWGVKGDEVMVGTSKSKKVQEEMVKVVMLMAMVAKVAMKICSNKRGR